MLSQRYWQCLCDLIIIVLTQGLCKCIEDSVAPLIFLDFSFHFDR